MGIVRPVSFTAATLMGASVLVAPTSLANGCIFANFGGGTGTSSDPLLVATADHLDELKDDSNCWGYEFLQTADIGMAGATWTSGIGDATDAFSGIYDGGGYTISDLSIDESSTNYLGLFGKVEGVTAAVSRLNFSGTVSGNNYAGGLVGRNLGDVHDSSFTGSVTGNEFIGGLVGRNDGQIRGSFATGGGLITATNDIAGGLVGQNENLVQNSFATVNVRSRDTAVGLIGHNSTGATVSNSYATGFLDSAFPQGLVDNTSGNVSASYWDTQTSGTIVSDGGEGKTTDQMKTLSTFSGWSIASGWDATATWGICSAVNSGYPFLTAFYTEDPCTSEPSAVGSSTPARYQFTFWLPDGRQCTSISPITVTAGTSYELPGADAACAVTGSVVTGWRIPGQSAAFAPGRRVQVSGSQQFTAVLEYSWVDVVFDTNVAMSDQCLSDGSDSTQREASWSVPRELLLVGEVPVPESAPCTPPGHSLVGWSTEPTGNRTPLSTLPAPAVDTDGNPANTVHLYAIWEPS
ncbi:MAG TPA: GLUG motif-containing protein [Acidimicrobiia bacterium]